MCRTHLPPTFVGSGKLTKTYCKASISWIKKYCINIHFYIINAKLYIQNTTSSINILKWIQLEHDQQWYWWSTELKFTWQRQHLTLLGSFQAFHSHSQQTGRHVAPMSTCNPPVTSQKCFGLYGTEMCSFDTAYNLKWFWNTKILILHYSIQSDNPLMVFGIILSWADLTWPDMEAHN